MEENFPTYGRKLPDPMEENFQDNNTVNNTYNNIYVDFDALIGFFNKVTGKNTKVVNAKTRKQINARIKEGYSKEDLANAIRNCFNDPYHKENPKYLTLEFISRPDKLDKYLNAVPSKVSIPEDWFWRELSLDQQKMLSPTQMQSWRQNKSKVELEGGRLKPIQK